MADIKQDGESQNPFWTEQEAVVEDPGKPISTARPHWSDSVGCGLVLRSLFLGALVGAVVVAAIAFPIAALSGRNVEAIEGPLMPVAISAPFIIFWLLVRVDHHDKLREFERQEAAGAQALLESSQMLAQRMPGVLDQASESALRAENEYRENAFGPFWDAVEQAARHLDSFNQGARQLSDKAQRYYMLVKNRQDTLPDFRVQPEALPNAAPVLAEFRRIVRLGQTDFQFATIWEQRKTRGVLIAGFRTLGEAIDNLGSTIEQSMSQLSSGVAQLVEEQIRTRETIDRRAQEQGRMLDNIQRHRKAPI